MGLKGKAVPLPYWLCLELALKKKKLLQKRTNARKCQWINPLINLINVGLDQAIFSIINIHLKLIVILHSVMRINPLSL